MMQCKNYDAWSVGRPQVTAESSKVEAFLEYIPQDLGIPVLNVVVVYQGGCKGFADSVISFVEKGGDARQELCKDVVFLLKTAADTGDFAAVDANSVLAGCVHAGLRASPWLKSWHAITDRARSHSTDSVLSASDFGSLHDDLVDESGNPDLSKLRKAAGASDKKLCELGVEHSTVRIVRLADVVAATRGVEKAKVRCSLHSATGSSLLSNSLACAEGGRDGEGWNADTRGAVRR